MFDSLNFVQQFTLSLNFVQQFTLSLNFVQLLSLLCHNIFILLCKHCLQGISCEDTFVCESRYLSKTKSFRKIKVCVCFVNTLCIPVTVETTIFYMVRYIIHKV